MTDLRTRIRRCLALPPIPSPGVLAALLVTLLAAGAPASSGAVRPGELAAADGRRDSSARADLVAQADVPAEREDLLSFAMGALPVRVEGQGTSIGNSYEHAIEAIDGDPVPTTLNLRAASSDTDFVYVYELPAPTTFDRFAVPEVHEVPSLSTTFVRYVEVTGSSVGSDGPFETLASAELAVHTGRGEVTELRVTSTAAVRWVRVRLSGALQDPATATFLQFSELIGNGVQEQVPMSTAFDGTWDPRGGAIELEQVGPLVSGCADGGRKTVTGSVVGRTLFATLRDVRTGVPGALVLSVASDGSLSGLRSDNGAPFRYLQAPAAPSGTAPQCSATSPTTLGCDSVIHGIRFAYDSAELSPESSPIIDALFAGLSADSAAQVDIVGHTSSEGSDAYNQDLSARRASAVVDALVARGIAPGRLSAVGRGESDPIADNSTETGRALNRRVEVDCRPL